MLTKITSLSNKKTITKKEFFMLDIPLLLMMIFMIITIILKSDYILHNPENVKVLLMLILALPYLAIIHFVLLSKRLRDTSVSNKLFIAILVAFILDFICWGLLIFFDIGNMFIKINTNSYTWDYSVYYLLIKITLIINILLQFILALFPSKNKE